jgi:hypothetical protein
VLSGAKVTDIAAVRVFLLYGIDPLEAVPVEDFLTTPALHKVRWPQIISEVAAKRQTSQRLRRDQPELRNELTAGLLCPCSVRQGEGEIRALAGC